MVYHRILEFNGGKRLTDFNEIFARDFIASLINPRDVIYFITLFAYFPECALMFLFIRGFFLIVCLFFPPVFVASAFLY